MAQRPLVNRETPPGKRWIFRPYITLPDGSRLYAWQRGKKAFPILIDE